MSTTVPFVFILQIFQKNSQNSWLLHPSLWFLPQSIIICNLSIETALSKVLIISTLTNWLLQLLPVWPACSMLLLTIHSPESLSLIQSTNTYFLLILNVCECAYDRFFISVILTCHWIFCFRFFFKELWAHTYLSDSPVNGFYLTEGWQYLKA